MTICDIYTCLKEIRLLQSEQVKTFTSKFVFPPMNLRSLSLSLYWTCLISYSGYNSRGQWHWGKKWIWRRNASRRMLCGRNPFGQRNPFRQHRHGTFPQGKSHHYLLLASECLFPLFSLKLFLLFTGNFRTYWCNYIRGAKNSRIIFYFTRPN